MSSKIKILDEITINQIAAGEVIENASSVVKELVDNALDAGSTEIVIEVQGSGRQSIVVQDNGCGMSYDDLQLCLERHATSKIRSQEDLWRISTMGFRGEALSAISSISHLSILTAQGDGLNRGHFLEASGGTIKAISEAQGLRGCKITVSELFFNVPARRKFLKSPNQEAKDILKVVTLHALSRPDVGFELIINGKKELKLYQNDNRIQALLGKELFSALVPINFENDWLKLKGFIAKPTTTRPNRTQQYLFVNDRAVYSSFISNAVKQAFGSSIEESRHPVFLLNIDIAKDRVDVNVHPQKKEVRFSFEEDLKLFLFEAISQVLFCRVEEKPSFVSNVVTSHYSYIPMPLEMKPASFVEEQIHIVGIYKEYILIENSEKNLLFIHSRHAMSRIAYEEWQEMWRQQKKVISSQSLLVPHFIECTVEEAESVKSACDKLHQLGIGIREFGKNSFLVESLPPFLENIDLEEFLHHVACSDDKIGKHLDQLLCEAFRYQKPIADLTVQIGQKIAKKLLACREPERCPFGNSTMFVLTHDEIRKRL